jgi:hypothetical protein
MGAQPKNKISSIERGKRRSGNTKKVTKDPAVSRVPLHKRSFLSRVKQAVGLDQTPTA